MGRVIARVRVSERKREREEEERERRREGGRRPTVEQSLVTQLGSK